MLRVWVNETPVGRLARHGRGTTFVYDAGVLPENAVSLTMPVRVASYDISFGMLPAFDMNMPEGELLRRVHSALAKDDRGRVDPLDILALTGGNQIGRVRILPDDIAPERGKAFHSIDNILKARSGSALLNDLVDYHGIRSGVSGAMPKVLAETKSSRLGKKSRITVRTDDWILKFDASNYPGLSLNEMHCLEAARHAGNRTSSFRLSDDGRMLAVKRFDAKGRDRLGFEDFASLNAKTATMKYEASMETGLFKRAASLTSRAETGFMERLYRQVITSVALRNGDAHLKNFAVLYDDIVNGPITLSPCYDIVTTKAFPGLRNDRMALGLKGTRRWPGLAHLRQLGARAHLTPGKTDRIIAEVVAGVREQLPRMVFDLRSRRQDVLAERMSEEWNDALAKSFETDPVDVPVQSERDWPARSSDGPDPSLPPRVAR